MIRAPRIGSGRSEDRCSAPRPRIQAGDTRRARNGQRGDTRRARIGGAHVRCWAAARVPRTQATSHATISRAHPPHARRVVAHGRWIWVSGALQMRATCPAAGALFLGDQKLVQKLRFGYFSWAINRGSSPPLRVFGLKSFSGSFYRGVHHHVPHLPELVWRI